MELFLSLRSGSSIGMCVCVCVCVYGCRYVLLYIYTCLDEGIDVIVRFIPSLSILYYPAIVQKKELAETAHSAMTGCE